MDEHAETLAALKRFGAKRYGDRVKILIEEKWRWAKFIGAGAYSNVFLLGRNDVIIYVTFDDQSKHIISNTQHVKKHIPLMVDLDVIINTIPIFDWNIQVYRSKLYNVPLRRYQHPELFNQMKRLQQLVTICAGHGQYERNEKLVKAVKIHHTVRNTFPASLVEALEQLTFEASNWDTYAIGDFHPRNMGTDNLGNLILLDPLFCVDSVQSRAVQEGKKGLRKFLRGEKK